MNNLEDRVFNAHIWQHILMDGTELADDYPALARYMDMINDDLTEHQIRTMQINLILDDHHIEADPAKLAEEFIINVMEKIHIYPDAETTINTLAEKYTLCMITNGAKDNQRLKIARLPFRHHFKEIIISGDIKHHKPDPVIFNTMTTRLKTAPKEMTYIGNDYQKDIQGAYNAGWKTVWINRKNEPLKAPDHAVIELNELLKVY